ncbi:MAG: ATP-binding protein [Coriobacteriia bacterium]|nr:ATP-binding protein [Coriobacteriia bacterium]MBN2839582.1 ATP-binding protein [Coriobacteriia bacterium]
MTSDRITLTVPARGEYAKTVRMTAAELASRLGMSYDEVDDVRIAAEEAFVYASDCVGEDEDVTFRFIVSPGMLEIAVGPMPDHVGTEAPGVSESYAEFILQSVCDEFEIGHSAEGCTLRLCRRAAVPVGEPGA